MRKLMLIALLLSAVAQADQIECTDTPTGKICKVRPVGPGPTKTVVCTETPRGVVCKEK